MGKNGVHTQVSHFFISFFSGMQEGYKFQSLDLINNYQFIIMKTLTPLCCAVHIQVAKGQYIEGLILKYGFVAAARRTGGAAAAGPNSAV